MSAKHQLVDVAFIQTLRDGLSSEYDDCDAVCLSPEHEHSHPVMAKAGSWVVDPFS